MRSISQRSSPKGKTSRSPSGDHDNPPNKQDASDNLLSVDHERTTPVSTVELPGDPAHGRLRRSEPFGSPQEARHLVAPTPERGQ